MGQLMVCDRKGARSWNIEQFAALLLAHGKMAGLPQRAIEVHGPTDRRDPIFGKDDDAAAKRDRVMG